MDIREHLDDWVCLTAEGEPSVSPWGVMTDQPYLFSMCMNAEG